MPLYLMSFLKIISLTSMFILLNSHRLTRETLSCIGKAQRLNVQVHRRYEFNTRNVYWPKAFSEDDKGSFGVCVSINTITQGTSTFSPHLQHI